MGGPADSTEASGGGTARRLLAPAALMVLVWVLSDQPDPNPAPSSLALETSSLAHVVVFGALCAAWAWALPGRGRPLLLAVALTIGYGVVDELHQSTTPGRDATPVDVALDALGAVLVALALARYGRSTSKTSRPRTRSAV